MRWLDKLVNLFMALVSNWTLLPRIDSSKRLKQRFIWYTIWLAQLITTTSPDWYQIALSWSSTYRFRKELLVLISLILLVGFDPFNSFIAYLIVIVIIYDTKCCSLRLFNRRFPISIKFQICYAKAILVSDMCGQIICFVHVVLK